MTPQRWKTAGVLLLILAALLVVASLVVVLVALASPGSVTPMIDIYPPVAPSGTAIPVAGVLRGVVLGAFAGVAFFLGLACCLWGALGDARQQRAELLIELAVVRARLDRPAAG